MWRDSLRESLALLRTPRFGTFWFASLLSNIGTWAQQVAQPWLMLSLGASSFLIGLDAFALGAPVWLLTVVGGFLADHADRRKVIARFQSVQMLCPTAIALMLVFGTIHPWEIIALSLVVGVTDALSMPSFQSIVPSLVSREKIAAGLALNSTQFNLSRILGPVFAGMLLAGIGAVGCFALSAASYLPFIAIALWMLPRQAQAAHAEPFGVRQLFAGVRATVAEPRIRGALATVLAGSFFCGPLLIFCPVLVKEAMHGDVGHFSSAIGAFGAGGLLGALGIMATSSKSNFPRLSNAFALMQAAAVALVAINPWLWALPVLLVVAGLSMNVSNTSANSFLQGTTASHLRGQAVSLYMLAMRGGLSVGSLLTGAVAHLWGVREALLLNGVLALAIQFWVGHEWRRATARLAP